MKRHTMIKLLIQITFIISLSLVIISAWNILTAKVKVEANLRQWEKMKQKERMTANEDDLRIEPLLIQPLSFATYLDQQQVENNERDDSRLHDEITVTHDELIEMQEDMAELLLYEHDPEKGELIGTITIPQLDKELPIIHGTDNKQLAEGVGHYIGSAMPGERNNSVLAGHRDTVFRGLGKLQIGDQIQIETIAGLFTYEIVKQQIVEADDRTIIVSHDEPILTLITCYPFDYVGPAPKRYILTGKLIDP